MKAKLGMVLNVAIAAALMLSFAGCARQSGKTTSAKTASGLQKVYFDFDKSDIKSEYTDELQSNAAWMKANPNAAVLVEGHCDERGSYEYNIALGNRRAMSTKNYLVNLGVNGSNLSTISYGEERPAATCHDESCWWQNRRAEFSGK